MHSSDLEWDELKCRVLGALCAGAWCIERPGGHRSQLGHGFTSWDPLPFAFVSSKASLTPEAREGSKP